MCGCSSLLGLKVVLYCLLESELLLLLVGAVIIVFPGNQRRQIHAKEEIMTPSQTYRNNQIMPLQGGRLSL